MRLFLILILLTCICVPVFAAETIESVERYVVEGTLASGPRVLSVPRDHIVADDNTGIMLFNAGYSGKHFYYTVGLDSASDGWSDTADFRRIEGVNVGSFSDHSHLSITHIAGGNDVALIAVPSGGDSLTIKRWEINASTGTLEDTTESYSPPSANPGDLTIYRGAPWYVPGTDTVLLVTRGHDNDPARALDVSYFLSDDGGDTWGTISYLWDLSSSGGQNRIGAMNFFDSTVSAVILDVTDTEAFRWYNWNRTTHAWVLDATIPIANTSNFHRGYCFTAVEDTNQFMACTRSDNDWMDYYWKSKGEGTFNHDSIQGTAYENTGMHMDVCGIEAANAVAIFYSKNTYANRDSGDVYCRIFDFDDESISDETLISVPASHRVHYQHAQCMNVPASHGAVAYFGYFSLVGGAYDEYILARVNLDVEDSGTPMKRRRRTNSLFK